MSLDTATLKAEVGAVTLEAGVTHPDPRNPRAERIPTQR